MRRSFAIGIDFGGTKMLAAAVAPDGSVLHEVRVPTPTQPAPLCDAIAEVSLQILSHFPQVKCTGVGIGAAGLVDKSGLYRLGPNVGGVAEIDLAAEMRARFARYENGDVQHDGAAQSALQSAAQHSFPVRVVNDNTAATWGEFQLGAGRGYNDVVFIGLGTGIGGGFVVDGALALGGHGMSGEFGHMLVEYNGAQCVCGARGCWEAYGSGRALGRMGREALASALHEERSTTLLDSVNGDVLALTGEHVTSAARSGDEVAKEVLREFAGWVAVGVANAIAFCDPECVVIGGGMSGDADLFLDDVKKRVGEVLFGVSHRPTVHLQAAQLGPRAGVVGAALLSMSDV